MFHSFRGFERGSSVAAKGSVTWGLISETTAENSRWRGGIRTVCTRMHKRWDLVHLRCGERRVFCRRPRILLAAFEYYLTTSFMKT